jgi:hypothetical protein
MDPITLIIAALAAGASAGTIDALKDNAKEAATAAYGKLQDLVKRRFGGNPGIKPTRRPMRRRWPRSSPKRARAMTATSWPPLRR